MGTRVRLFVWAGTALLTALSFQPASEVLAADWRGAEVATEASSAALEMADRTPAPVEPATLEPATLEEVGALVADRRS